MKDEDIILSEKHGINPSISTCLLCGKEVGIVLFGKLKNDEEAPMKCCTGELCDDCKNKLIDNKEIVFVDFETGRYIAIPEDLLTSEGKEVSKETRTIILNSDAFNSIFINK